MYMMALDRWFPSIIDDKRGLNHWKHRGNFKVGSDSENVYAEIASPGLDGESLKIEFMNNLLSVSGKTVETKLSKPENVQYQLEVLEEINPDEINAEYKHGLLSLTMAKPSKEKPRQIKVFVK